MQWFNKRSAILILLILSAASAFFGYGVSQSGFDYDFEKFFPPGDTETEFFEGYRTEFENDYDFLLIAAKSSKGIYDTSFLQKINRLTDTLSTVPFVIDVRSITNFKIPVLAGGEFGTKKFVHLHNDSLLQIDSIKLNQTHELEGSFISSDQKTTCLFVQNAARLSKKKSDSLLASIERITYNASFEEVHMAGKIKAQQIYLNRMQKEIVFFVAISAVIVIIFLAITFQTVSNTLVPLSVVILSVTWQLGIMHFVGKKIDILTVLLPTILFIVGMSDVIHILSKYLEDLRSGLPKKQALIKTIKEVGFATFLTSFITALGFFTLVTANISPIREFGIYTGIGVLIAYFLSITLMPSILMLLPPPKIVENPRFDRWWNKVLHRQLLRVFRNRKTILITAVSFVVITGSGIYFLKVNNLLLEDLSDREPLRKEFSFFEKEFSGGRPFEMYIETKDPNNNLLSFSTIQEIKKLEDLAKEKFQLGFVQSPVWLLKMANRSINSGLNEYYRLPATEQEHTQLINKLQSLDLFNDTLIREFRIFSKDLRRCRISGKMHDLGSYKVRTMEANFEKEAPVLKNIKYRLTGSARLVDKNISFLAINLMQGLGSGIVIVAIIFGLMYRSWKMILIALSVNILPMLCVAGIMGYLGIDIKVSTSMIFTIAFGIAEDDTIHFLSRFQIERRNGRTVLYAIKRSFLSTGKAMILTSIVLCAGFITMISSGFMSIYYVGLLLSLTLFIALFADLCLLPIFLLSIKNKASKKT
jgi:predicted RND superfamily exporter protein